VGSLNLEVFMTQLMEGEAAASVASAAGDGEKKTPNVGVEKGAELLPEDCPPFYEELRATIASVPVLCGNAEMQEALVRLEPDTYFPNGVRITKSAAQKYGRELMELFSLMCKAHRKSAAKVVARLCVCVVFARAFVCGCVYVCECVGYCASVRVCVLVQPPMLFFTTRCGVFCCTDREEAGPDDCYRIQEHLRLSEREHTSPVLPLRGVSHSHTHFSCVCCRWL
jgi:hypothetical protein